MLVAMESYNGWARPLDTLVRSHGYRLFNINNLKLARFKEIFPAAAKSDRIDARKGLELFQLCDHLPSGTMISTTPIRSRRSRWTQFRRRSRNYTSCAGPMFEEGVVKAFQRSSWDYNSNLP